MAHFIGSVKGGRGRASRLGTKSSGMTAAAQGWNIGGAVEVNFEPALDDDIVTLYANGGSTGGQRVVVGHYRRINGVITPCDVNGTLKEGPR